MLKQVYAMKEEQDIMATIKEQCMQNVKILEMDFLILYKILEKLYLILSNSAMKSIIPDF